ncbi:MAG: hypothetical protein JST75_22290 [Bacteroidetes bacterium]|nr:hypothetical protein [Bacteroidota bacterium]
MRPLTRISSLFPYRKNAITFAFFIVCNQSYSQNIFCTGDEMGVSKLDSTGMMSEIIWTKSKIFVLLNEKTDRVHVFLTNALRSQLYEEVILIKKVETAENDIRTFHARDSEGDECILVFTRKKTDGKEEQLRIYLADKTYIYNFGKT